MDNSTMFRIKTNQSEKEIFIVHNHKDQFVKFFIHDQIVQVDRKNLQDLINAANEAIEKMKTTENADIHQVWGCQSLDSCEDHECSCGGNN